MQLIGGTTGSKFFLTEKKNKPKVYLSRIIPEPALKLLRESCLVVLHPEKDIPPTRLELLSKTKDCDGVLILLTEKIDKEFIDNAPNLRAVSTYSVGYDHIDLSYASKKGIIVTNTPDVLTETTADLAFALILAASRRIVEGDRYIRAGLWNKPWSPYFLVGNDVFGKTLGIVGMGRIGKALLRRAGAFQMNVLYFDRKGKNDEIESDRVRYSDFEPLLEESDFISVHVPLDSKSEHMFGDREFSLMKKSAVFVNTSRGGIVDTFSLYSALKNGKIFAAGLDVFEKEPIGPKNPLLELDNVTLSPHLGSASTQARSKMAELAAMNLIDSLEGRKPLGLINFPRVIDSPSRAH